MRSERPNLLLFRANTSGQPAMVGIVRRRRRPPARSLMRRLREGDLKLDGSVQTVDVPFPDTDEGALPLLPGAKPLEVHRFVA